jgi:tripartite-type tricarboxylate transporter receptor subunit TctC
LIAIGGSATQRSPLLPNVVPLAEQGLPGFDATTWFGLVAPAGTPPDIIQAYQQKIAEVLKRDEIREKLQKLGIDTITTSPEEFGRFIQSEVDKWGGVVRAVGVKLN